MREFLKTLNPKIALLDEIEIEIYEDSVANIFRKCNMFS